MGKNKKKQTEENSNTVNWDWNSDDSNSFTWDSDTNNQPIDPPTTTLPDFMTKIDDGNSQLDLAKKFHKETLDQLKLQTKVMKKLVKLINNSKIV